MKYQHTLGSRTYGFESLKDLLAKASPEKSGDALAGIAAANAEERVAAQMALARIYAGGCRGVLDIGNLPDSHGIGDNFKVRRTFFLELLGLYLQ